MTYFATLTSQRRVARELANAARLMRRERIAMDGFNRGAWRRRILRGLDAANARSHVDGAAVRAWLAATVGERLPLP